MWETWVRSLGWEDPLEKGVASHSNILAGEFHGQRSLADSSPWGCKESKTTKQFSLSFWLQLVKSLPVRWETRVRSLAQEDPLEQEMATTPVFLPGESHGQRILVYYSPWDHKEMDMTE